MTLNNIKMAERSNERHVVFFFNLFYSLLTILQQYHSIVDKYMLHGIT